MKKLLLTLAIGLMLIAIQGASAADRSTPQIWFSMRGYSTDWHGVNGRQGWERLFLQPEAPWPEFMNHVQVVAINTKAPDDVLAKAIAKLNQKHIKLAIESLAQSWVDQPKCGKGVEGYTDPPGNAQIARKIKAAGGEVTYITMDEPLFFGHFYSGRGACHSSIENVAERAAAIMREYKKVFPDVVIGDIEPIPSLTKQPGWQNAYREWMQAFQKAAGRPIAFVNLDVNWPEDGGRWRQSLKDAASFARASHVPVGIIYNAAIPGGAKSDRQWLDRAVQNFTEIEGRMSITPEKAVFESWAWFPKRSITDQSGPGEDYLVEKYLAMYRAEIAR